MVVLNKACWIPRSPKVFRPPQRLLCVCHQLPPRTLSILSSSNLFKSLHAERRKRGRSPGWSLGSGEVGPLA